MTKMVDPAMLIMENVALVDVDRYVERDEVGPENQSQEPNTHLEEEDASSHSPSGQKKEKMYSSMFRKLPKMKKMNIRASTYERFQKARKAYMKKIKKNVTAGEFLDHLLEADL